MNNIKEDKDKIINKRSKVEKKKIILALAGIVLIGLAIIIYFLYQGNTYVKTIDARVSSDMVSVIAPIPGVIEEILVAEGDAIKKGEIIGTIGSTTVNAPIDGSIVKINGSEGQAIGQGQALAYMANLKDLYISANIEETKIKKIKVGQEVEIRVDAYKKEKLKGRVSSVGMAANSMFSMIPTGSGNGSYTKITQLIPIKITLEENKDLNLLIGMNSEVKINIAKEVAVTDKDAYSKSNKKVISGVIYPIREYIVLAKAQGEIKEILVDKGDWVEEGTLLIKQDDTDLQLQAGGGGMASDSVERLRISYELLNSTYEQNKELYNQGAISKAIYDQSTSQMTNTKGINGNGCLYKQPG